MKKEPKIDELGRINIIQGNVYLIKDVNYTDYTNIYEWECLYKSETSYKFLDKITDRIFWIENTKFHSKSFGQSGYHTFECIYDKREEQARILKQLTER